MSLATHSVPSSARPDVTGPAPRDVTATDTSRASDPAVPPPPLRFGHDRLAPLLLREDRGAAFEDPVSAFLRFRRAIDVGAVTWLAFGLIDWAVVHYLQAGRLLYFFAVRVGLILVISPALWRLRQPKPLPKPVLSVIDAAMFSAAAIGNALMCVEFHGLASPYIPGFCLTLLSRTVTARDEPWRRALVLTAIPVLCFFAVLIGSAAFSTKIALQLHDPREVATLCLYSAYVVGASVSLVVGSHLTWALRRQVFEARNLGGYRLKHRLASGANGDVWVAHHGGMKRDVALKILRPDASRGVGVARFEREVRATAELSHPNTVRIYDFGTTEDQLWYYAMELLEGETLAALVRREGPLEPARVIRLALQVCRALAEAHGRGIVHRDVKPSNLFVATMGGEKDFAKVLDFGVARLSHDPGATERTMTATGHIVGTPAYISPEAALCKNVDARADVYATGAVLYFMLTGTPPFDEEGGATELLLAHAGRVPERPSARLGRPLPENLEAVVMRCLEKDPARRYADGTALAAALQDFASLSPC